jgi:SAM-dependent methyltransferase
MGIGSEDIELLIRLREAELLGPGGSIVEIGAQQLAPSFLLMTDRLKTLGQLFGVAGTLDLPGVDSSDTSYGDLHLQPTAPFAREFWQWLGFEYAAVDIDGNPGSIPLDLNYDRAPWNSKKKFDLVTNFGTTEHVANHLNAFKLIHDLTAQGGIMVHRLPCQGMFNHGFVNYNFKFFWMLARSNGYKFIHADFTDSPEPVGMPTDIIDFLLPFTTAGVERARNYRAVDAAILVVLQKTHNMAFVPPIDVPTGMKTDIKSLKRRYWTVFQPNAFK